MFTKLEEEGGRIRIPAVILIVYKVLGKTGTAAVFGGLGGLLLALGVKKVVSPAPEEEEEASAPPPNDDAP